MTQCPARLNTLASPECDLPAGHTAPLASDGSGTVLHVNTFGYRFLDQATAPRPVYAGRAFTAVGNDHGIDRPNDHAGRVIAMLADEYGPQVVLDQACDLLAVNGGAVAATPAARQAGKTHAQEQVTRTLQAHDHVHRLIVSAIEERAEQAEAERDATRERLHLLIRDRDAVVDERDEVRAQRDDVLRNLDDARRDLRAAEIGYEQRIDKLAHDLQQMTTMRDQWRADYAEREREHLTAAADHASLRQVFLDMIVKAVNDGGTDNAGAVMVEWAKRQGADL